MRNERFGSRLYQLEFLTERYIVQEGAFYKGIVGKTNYWVLSIYTNTMLIFISILS
jgi:hypothetical protein